MGMAHHAPFDQYTRTIGITDHAVARLREQLDTDAMANATHRSDDELRNMLDQAAMDAFGRDDFEQGSDRGRAVINVVRLGQLPVKVPIYGLVKESSDAGRGRDRFVMITVYTEEMVKVARAAGRWASVDIETARKSPVVSPNAKVDPQKINRVAAKFANNVGDKLATALELAQMKGNPIVPAAKSNVNATVEENVRKSRSAPIPTKAAPPSPPALPAPPPAPPVASATEMCLVTYHHAENYEHYSGSLQVVEFQRIELKQRLGELHGDAHIDKASIRIWREMKATVRVRVEVDIDGE